MQKQIKSDDVIKEKISFSDLVIYSTAIGAPAAYLIGMYYHKGLLSGFGIDVDTFPISTTDVYVNSYNAVSFFLFEILNKLYSIFRYFVDLENLPNIAITIITFLAVIYFLLKLKKNKKHLALHRISSKIFSLVALLHWKNNDFTKALGISGLAAYGVALTVSIPLYIIFLWIIIPSGAYQKAMQISQDKIDFYEKNGCVIQEKSKWSNCVMVNDNNGFKIEGLLFAISEQYIGIYNAQGNHLIKRILIFILPEIENKSHIKVQSY